MKMVMETVENLEEWVRARGEILKDSSLPNANEQGMVAQTGKEHGMKINVNKTKAMKVFRDISKREADNTINWRRRRAIETVPLFGKTNLNVGWIGNKNI